MGLMTMDAGAATDAAPKQLEDVMGDVDAVKFVLAAFLFPATFDAIRELAKAYEAWTKAGRQPLPEFVGDLEDADLVRISQALDHYVLTARDLERRSREVAAMMASDLARAKDTASQAAVESAPAAEPADLGTK
jgi:hypothetical protein